MSSGPFARSTDLQRLRDEGYDVDLLGGHLILRQVPYVNGACQILLGSLISPVTLSGEQTEPNPAHTVWFHGETPCNQHGEPLSAVIHSPAGPELAPGVPVDFMFSSKPPEGYPNYHAKMTAYARILTCHAQALDHDVTAATFPVPEETPDDSPFVYRDSASSRAGIAAMNGVFTGQRIAIVGLGGTGSYILDLVSKTPVREIHLFDGDDFLNHNAFRAPGAAPIDALRARPLKVEYLKSVYSHMHRGIVSHPIYIDEKNVSELAKMDFVFLAADQGNDKPTILARLEEFDRPFIDVGMGVENVDGALTGLLRVTTSLPGHRDHVRARNRIPLPDAVAIDDYATNIQIADLNALNATLAVVRWKKHVGLYHDLEHEGFSAFGVSANTLLNEDGL